jgi:MFS family permease
MRAVFVGVTNVVFTIVALVLVDKVGRRALLLTGTATCIVALGLLGYWFHSATWQHDLSWVALASLLLFMAGFAVGLGPVFWLMISEVYPLGVRSRAMSVATVANWGSNFLVSYFFLSLVSGIGKAGTFWLYGGLGALAFVYFAWRVPETKDRSLEEIERDLGVEPESDEPSRNGARGGKATEDGRWSNSGTPAGSSPKVGSRRGATAPSPN